MLCLAGRGCAVEALRQRRRRAGTTARLDAGSVAARPGPAPQPVLLLEARPAPVQERATLCARKVGLA